MTRERGKPRYTPRSSWVFAPYGRRLAAQDVQRGLYPEPPGLPFPCGRFPSAALRLRTSRVRVRDNRHIAGGVFEVGQQAGNGHTPIFCALPAFIKPLVDNSVDNLWFLLLTGLASLIFAGLVVLAVVAAYRAGSVTPREDGR